jgi:hypothetical protein
MKQNDRLPIAAYLFHQVGYRALEKGQLFIFLDR